MKEKEEGKCKVAERERERERERVTYMRQNVSAIVWGIWWCSTSTKLLTF